MVTIAKLCEPGDVLVASRNRAAHSLITLAPEMREAMRSVRRHEQRCADSKSVGIRALAHAKQEQAHQEYNALADQWVRLHELLDGRTAALVAEAIRAQFPDPEQRKRYWR